MDAFLPGIRTAQVQMQKDPPVSPIFFLPFPCDLPPVQFPSTQHLAQENLPPEADFPPPHSNQSDNIQELPPFPDSTVQIRAVHLWRIPCTAMPATILFLLRIRHHIILPWLLIAGRRRRHCRP